MGVPAQRGVFLFVLLCGNVVRERRVAVQSDQQDTALLFEIGTAHAQTMSAPSARCRQGGKDMELACLMQAQAMLTDLAAALDARNFRGSHRIGEPGDYVIERAFVEK